MIIPVIETNQIQQGLRDYKNIYSPLPVGMKANLQIEKALRNPTRRSSLGRPPESTSLKVILDDSNKKSTESIVRKVKTRLKRESDIALDDIVPSASRRKLVGVDKVKQVVSEKDKIRDVAIASVAERKSSLGLAISKINKLAKDPEVEKLGIEIRAEEWEKALQAISGRRGAIKATGKGLAKGTESAIYARVVKPKIIKRLLDEVRSGNFKPNNPKSYSERLKRIHDNFDELMNKGEGVDYRTLSRRDLAKRVSKVMEPEIRDITKKAKDFATNGNDIYDTFLGAPTEVTAGLNRAGITDRKAQYLMRLLMRANGLL